MDPPRYGRLMRLPSRGSEARGRSGSPSDEAVMSLPESANESAPAPASRQDILSRREPTFGQSFGAGQNDFLDST